MLIPGFKHSTSGERKDKYVLGLICPWIENLEANSASLILEIFCFILAPTTGSLSKLGQAESMDVLNQKNKAAKRNEPEPPGSYIYVTRDDACCKAELLGY